MKFDQAFLKSEIEKNLLSLYDFEDSFKVGLLKYSENIIYKITFENEKPVVFRIHRPGYHTESELKGELIWMNEIKRDTELFLPEIYKGKNGEYLQKLILPDGTVLNCSVISFLEGKAVGELCGEELLKSMEYIGEMTAKLHIQAICRDENINLHRPHWDIECFFGENAVWGHWQDYKGLAEDDITLFSECEKVIKAKLEEYGKSKETYGIIHADLHFYNIICDGDKNQIIDFDDCGYGYYLYDFGCSLVTYSEDLGTLTDAWLRGYEKVRTLTAADKKMLPLFLLLRRMVRLAWLSSHSDSDTAKTVGKDYLEVTKKLGEKFLMENKVN